MLRYIGDSRSFFPEDAQRDWFNSLIAGSLEGSVAQIVVDSVEKLIEVKGAASASDIKKIVADAIDSVHSFWDALPYPDAISEDFPEHVRNRYAREIDNVIDQVFQKLPLNKQQRTKLCNLAVFFLLKFPPGPAAGESGLVVAGYGQDDVYPSLRSFRIDGVFENRVLQTVDRNQDVGEHDASIVPFAQSEMVHTFMEGVEPGYQRIIEAELATVLEGYVDTVLKAGALRGGAATKFRETMKKINLTLLSGFKDATARFRHANFALPAMSVTAILPKDELAAMAESLVNLTVYRRRMSMADETVGGPVDVAVISKADGFIWIKRKHYFSPELNPQFFANYYR